MKSEEPTKCFAMLMHNIHFNAIFLYILSAMSVLVANLMRNVFFFFELNIFCMKQQQHISKGGILR